MERSHRNRAQRKVKRDVGEVRFEQAGWSGGCFEVEVVKARIPATEEVAMAGAPGG